MAPDTPYFRLSFFYLTYFASIGVFVPYFSVYLQSLDFSPAQIGELLAVVMVTKIIGPYLWGWVADHNGKRMRVIRSAMLLALVFFSQVLFVESYWSLLLVLLLYSFFWQAALPQFEATTMEYLGEHRRRYSHIRLWGSVGFIITVIGFGYLLEFYGPGLLPKILLCVLALVLLSTLLVNDVEVPSTQKAVDKVHVLPVLKQPAVILFLLACLFMQASHGPYYAFFSIYLGDYGYDGGFIGWLWALGVIAEIGVFLWVHRWLRQVKAVTLFQWSIFITAVRWVLIGTLVDHFWILLMAQLMHAASYGLFHAAAMELISEHFPGKLSGRGQALYASIGFGVGNASGSLMSGYLWTSQSPAVVFIVAAGLGFVGLLMALGCGYAAQTARVHKPS